MNPGRSRLLIFIIICISDDTVMFGTNINQTFVVIRYLVYLIVLLLLAFQSNDAVYSKIANWRVSGIAIIIGLAFVATMSMNGDLRNGYFAQVIVLLLAGFVALRLEFRVFLLQFCQIMFWLGIFSICFFSLSIFARPLLDFLPVTQNYAGEEFINSGLAMAFMNENIIRNTSIFREPGVFAIYLLTGLIVELFYKSCPSRVNVAVFLVAIITTASTSGFFVTSILLLGYVLRKNSLIMVLELLLVMLIVVIIIYVFPQLIDFVFSKFDKNSHEYGSALARLSSIFIPFSIFLSNPIFGAGLTNFFDQYLLISEQLYGHKISPDSASTNTIMNVFAIYGFVLGSLMVAGLIKFTWALTPNRLARLSCVIAFFLMVSSQELRFSLFFSCIIMYGLFYSALSKTNSNKLTVNLVSGKL